MAAPDMKKRATRYRAEIVDGEGSVLWEVLVRDPPKPKLANVLRSYGYQVRRTEQPEPEASGTLPLMYSELDPVNSIIAAREAAARRETHIANVLMLLIDRSPEWVPYEAISKVGGKEGDKRARELRARGWPIDIRQLAPRQPWHYRLLLPGWEGEMEALGSDDDGKLF